MTEVQILTSSASELIPSMVSTVRSSSERVILVVPGSFTLAAEQALIRASGSSGILGLNVFSPDALVHEIFELAGQDNRKLLTPDGRILLLSQILTQLKDRLAYYGSSVRHPGLAEKMVREIDELNDGGLTPDDLETSSTGMSPLSMSKIKDLALIWRTYLDKLGTQYVDSAGQWESAMNRLSVSGLVSGTHLMIFGFGTFNDNILNLVLAANDFAARITLGIICPDEPDQEDVFRYVSQSIVDFQERLNKHAIKSVRKSAEHYPYAVSPSLLWLQDVLRNNGTISSSAPDLSALTMYRARNSYTECLHTAQTLIQWHKEGISWNEMAVVIAETNTLPGLMPMVLETAGVPCSMRSGETMQTSDFSQYFLSVLRAAADGMHQRDMLRIIKSGFIGLSGDEALMIENYTLEHGIDGKLWETPFPVTEDDPESAELEALRKRLVEPLVALHSVLASKSCKGRIAAETLYQYVIDSGAYSVLLRREQELLDSGNAAAADRNRQVFTALIEVLDQLGDLLADVHVPLDQLVSMLTSSLSVRVIKSLPQTADSVIISDPAMLLTSGIRGLIIVGLQDNISAASISLLTEEERMSLSNFMQHQIGLNSEQLSLRLYQELYQSASMAADRIELSCSIARTDGGTLRPSAFFDACGEVLEKQYPGNIRGSVLDDCLEPFSPQFALESLAVRLRNMRDYSESLLNGEKTLPWRQTLAALYHDENWHNQTAEILNGLHARVYTPGITIETAGQLYNPDHMSISRLETFAVCPRMQFLQSGLRLRPRKLFTYENDQRGTFMHEVLKRFFREASAHPKWPDLSRDEINKILDPIFREAVKTWEGTPLVRDTVHRYQGAGIIRMIREAAISMTESLKNGPHFLPFALEVPFGNAKSDAMERFPAVRLELADGRIIRLDGVIDRVDTLVLPDGTRYFAVRDFKSSDKELRRTLMGAGIQLQLPLYIVAASQGLPDYQPAAGLYQPVISTLIDARDDDKDSLKSGRQKSIQAKGLILNNNDVKKALDPVKLPRGSATSDVIALVSVEEMEEAYLSALETASISAMSILSGVTQPAPVQTGQRIPCEYCSGLRACMRDARLKGGRVNVLK